MSEVNKRMPGRRRSKTGRKSKNTFVTKSGQTIKLNRSLTDKIKARKDARAQARAKRLAGMPKSRIKRFFYRMHPKRLYKYWFSREGGIMALKITGIGIIAGFLFLVGLFAYFRKDLPNLKDISGNNLGGSIRYFDRSGKTLLWEDFDAVKRVPVSDENISDYAKKATIAIEDKDFFSHGGFDVRGITRAAFNNVTGGGVRQGGSTITQQLVRLTQKDVGMEQTYTRKIKEIVLSVELERSYSKQEILTGYLNTAPYGNVQYGVESATRDYFQKSAKDLTLDEAAFLAAIPQSPSYYSPYGASYNPEALVGRQHYVLDEMERQGMITAEERDEAKKIKTTKKVKKPKAKYTGITAPWFVLSAKEALETKYPNTADRGGWDVITTLDLELQRMAEKQVSNGMGQIRSQGGDVAAFVAEDVESGEIVALVGGSDFNNEEYGQNNYARYRLPPGSGYKPHVYAALIENSENVGAGSVFYDTQAPLPGYPCTNRSTPRNGGNCLWDYDLRFPGPVTLRYSLGGSRNVPAVKAMLTTGINETIKMTEKMGLKSSYKCYEDDGLTKEAQCYGASAIGDGAYLKMDEHVHTYGTFSRNGKYVPQKYLLKIKDASGKSTPVSYDAPEEKETQAIRPDTAYIISDILSDPRASYISRKPHRFNGGNGEWKFAMKTGTTNDGKDGWMMGYSSKYAAGVWVGYHNRRVAMSGFMENMTLPIWQGWMQDAHRGQKAKDWEKPAGVQSLPAYVVRNHVGVSSIEPSPTNDLFPSWFKKAISSNKKQTIDIISNKLATECTPDRAKKTTTGGDANSFSVDKFVGTGGGANTSTKDDVHKCDDVKPRARFASTTDNGGGNYTIYIDVTKGTHPLSSDAHPGSLTVSIDGKQVHSSKVTKSGMVTFNYKASSNGSKKVTATIVDSVLYDNSDSGTFTASGVSATSLTITNDSGPNHNKTIQWVGGQGVVTIYDADSNSPTSCSSASGQCTANLSGVSRVYAKDEDDNVSDTVDL